MALQGDAAKALEAVKNGKDPVAEVYGETAGIADDRIVHSEEVEPLDTNSTLDSIVPSQSEEETSELSSEAEAEDSLDQEEDPVSEGNVELLTVTDDKGRRKVKVDFNDKEQLKKYVRMAHGMRKFQAERDAARAQLKKFEGVGDPEKAFEKANHWDTVEDAYSKAGLKGLVNLIEGRDGAYEEFEQSVIDRYERRRNATPKELEALDTAERAEQMARELEAMKRRQEQFEENSAKEREKQELAAMQSRFSPVFEKYRFAGKLGDDVDEQMFDDMLWRASLTALEPYEEKGMEITPELIERTFRDRANALRRRIRSQANRTVKKAVKQKKQEATENAQSKVMKGFQANSTAEKARELLNGPNSGVKDILANWGTFKNVFNR